MNAKIPKLEDLSQESQALYEVLNDESDLACVLIATSYLDQTLASLLERYFVEGNTSQRLLDPRGGVLGTFASRADLSYCLGLIPKGLYQNLRIVGEIRNRFAHNYLLLDFNDQDIIDQVGKLSFPRVKEIVSADDKSPFERITHPRDRFNIVTAMMVSRLLLTGLSIERRTRRLKGW